MPTPNLFIKYFLSILILYYLLLFTMTINSISLTIVAYIDALEILF